MKRYMDIEHGIDEKKLTLCELYSRCCVILLWLSRRKDNGYMLRYGWKNENILLYLHIIILIWSRDVDMHRMARTIF